MSFLLLVFFILLPIVEITLLIDIGSNIGAGATILLIIATAVVGVGLVRYQGL
ncbi:MAG: FxsA family protein, partial [Pseudomonadota bacterium]|nr:FxsA family protein [Pseudomonadota bacterium]